MFSFKKVQSEEEKAAERKEQLSAFVKTIRAELRVIEREIRGASRACRRHHYTCPAVG